MGIRSAKDAIREARLKAGITQDKLAEGICSLQSLSRIETGIAGVSPATFQALMEHAGAPCGRFPVFTNQDDFDCFYALKHARFYLDAWQLASAYEELLKLEARKWADNKLYYQEWLLLHCRLQFRSYRCAHRQNHHTLLDALHITRPLLDLSDFRKLLLSQNEIQILTALAQEALYLGHQEICLRICFQLENYLSNSQFTALEKERMQAETAIVYTKYLISTGDFEAALQVADTHRHKMVVNADTTPLFELTFLTGLCWHYIGNSKAASQHIKAAFYSAYAVDSCYATVCRNYLHKKTDFPVTEYMASLPDIPLQKYPAKEALTHLNLSDGIYSADATDVFTLGHLIQKFRVEQHISQKVLCQGLCSNSKLSKIENGLLQPDIALAEALLQRLGISERIFTFWGTERDAKLHDLKFKLIHDRKMSKDIKEKYLCEMKQLLSKNDILYYQTYLISKAFQSNSAKDRIAGLMKALRVTLPNFDIHKIDRYRLSWAELSILNNIAHEYRYTEKSYLSSLYFLQILEYTKTAKLDILLQANFLPHTIRMYCHNLYTQKLYHEAMTLPNQIDMSIMKFNASQFGGYLFCYSQALGECKDFGTITLAATQACALNDLMEFYRNSSLLRKYIYEDFSISLNI